MDTDWILETNDDGTIAILGIMIERVGACSVVNDMGMFIHRDDEPNNVYHGFSMFEQEESLTLVDGVETLCTTHYQYFYHERVGAVTDVTKPGTYTYSLFYPFHPHNPAEPSFTSREVTIR